MARAVLPQRRLCERFDLRHGEIDYAITVGLTRAGLKTTVGEVFISSHRKVGTGMSALARDAAISISLALQHGCPLDILATAFTREADGSPAGLAGAVVDALLARGMA